jgi:chromosome partitioning protein
MVLLPGRLREPGNALHAYRAVLDPLREFYDYILLDMRPAIDTDTNSQTAAADAALIMADVDTWAMKALGLQIAQHIKIMKDLGLPPDALPILGLIIGNIPVLGDFSTEVLDTLRSHPTIPCVGEVRIRTSIKEARAQGLPIQQFRPRSDAAKVFRGVAQNAGLVVRQRKAGDSRKAVAK